MARHLDQPPLARSAAGWTFGFGTIALLVAAIWTLASEPAVVSETSVGIFGAAARPGSFAGITTSTSTTTTRPAPTTTSTPVTTIPASTVSTEPTTTTTTLAPIILAADGLTVVDLGDPFEEVSAAVSARLGSPTEDTGWVGATSDFGICPGTVVRMQRWSSLRLLYSDGPTEFEAEGRHFFYFSQSTVGTDEVLDLVTAEGVGLETTVPELEAAFGDTLSIESTAEFGVTFYVTPAGPGLLSGTLTNSGPEGIVTSLGGGFGCGG